MEKNEKTAKKAKKQKKPVIDEQTDKSKNPDSKLCDMFMIAKNKFCKFEKHKNSIYCNFHISDGEEFINCPLDPHHTVSVKKLKKHLQICSKVKENLKVTVNPWYVFGINKLNKNEVIEKSLKDGLNNFKWDDFSKEEYESMLDLIENTFLTLQNNYKKYVDKIAHKYQIDNKIAAIDIEKEKEFIPTKEVSKPEKSKIQSKNISELIKDFNLLNEKNTFIEFGAGKGGLSYTVNSLSNFITTHILLEREGVRNKKDRLSEKITRFRTDIQDFDINYINEWLLSKNLDCPNLFGIAKHICGSGLDLSLQCLLNHKDQTKIKGIAFATCCHHKCDLDVLVNLDYYLNTLKLNFKQIVMIVKATSWIFGPIDSNSIKGDFLYKNKTKSYYGKISKYIIDLTRCFFLIQNNFDVIYLKYCESEITPENNLILALKPN